MRRAKRIWLIVAAIPLSALVLFFATAHYGVERVHNIRYISRPPIATLSWGPSERFMVQEGVNLVWDQGLGAAGNMVEFSVSTQTRVSMRLFSFRWLEEEFTGWRSNHAWARPRCEERAAAENHAADTLVGTWRLVSYVDTPEGAEPIYAFGKEPIGLFIFTADGHVSISIMRNPPAPAVPTADPDPDACVPGWYCAYFGTYTVDPKAGTWATHVLGGNIPSFLGTDQTRSFSISGDKLVISESYLEDQRRVRAERVLIRERQSR